MRKQLGSKLLCIALAFQMLLGLGMPAFAAESQPEGAEPIDLLTRTPTDWANGYGDTLFNGNNAGGRPITLWDGEKAVEYGKGIGMHAFNDTSLSYVSYDISSFEHNVFRATVGVDYNSDNQNADRGSCEFKVLIDGEEVYGSGVVRGSYPATEVVVLIPAGTETLTLAVANGGDGDSCDWADWVAPRLEDDPDAPLKFNLLTAAIGARVLTVPETAQLMVNGLRLNGDEIDHMISNCTFTSSDDSIATVNSTGLVTACSVGKVQITATATLDGITKSASASVTVLPGMEDVKTVTSPTGGMKFQMVDVGEGTWNYLTRLDEEVVIELSPLGLNTSWGDFTGGLTFEGRTDREINETYPMISGKKSEYTNHCNETTFTFSKEGVEDVTFQIIVRAYDDGIAFRYGIETTKGDSSFTVSAERSGFQVPAGSATTMLSYGGLGFCAEDQYAMGTIEQTRDATYNMPFLYQTAAHEIYVLVTEAALSPSYCGSVLRGAGDNLMNVAFAPTQGEEPVVADAPWTSPWRTAIIGGPKEIVENTMVENLSPACVIEDTSWIEPATTSWTWYTAGMPGQNNPDYIKQSIDTAAEFGWKYFLMDEGWQSERVDGDPDKWPGGPDDWHRWVGIPDWLEEIVAYGEERGVKIMAWVHSGDLSSPKEQEFIAELHEIGIVGMKIDFFDSESQQTMQNYVNLYRICAENEMMLDIHGANKPTGEVRTWPHLLTREGIRAQEFNDVRADIDTMYVFTRTAVGPADFNPCINLLQGGDVTAAHKVALNVLYETGLPCPSDWGDTYKRYNLFPLMKELPARWDDIRYIDGVPGGFATLARRSGEDWFAASICTDAQNAVIPLDFLDAGEDYYACIYRDGDSRWEMGYDVQAVTSADTLTVPMLQNGGCTLKIIKADSRAPECIELDQDELAMTSGETVRLNSSLTPEDPAQIYEVTWSSSNTEIADVDKTGLITAHQMGTAIITATATARIGDLAPLSAQCRVAVAPVAYSLAKPWRRGEPTAQFEINTENSVTLYPLKGELGNASDPAKNVLEFAPADEDFTLTVKCEFTPISNFQSAGIFAAASDDRYVGVMRRYHGNFGGNIFESIKMYDGWNEPCQADQHLGDAAWLKLEKTGNTFKTYYSFDEESWTSVGDQTLSLNDGERWSIKVAAFSGYTSKDGNEPAVLSDFTYNGTLTPFAVKNNMSRRITGIVDPEPVSADVDTPIESLDLPQTVRVHFEDGSTTDVGVTWTCGDYDAGTPKSYQFAGTLAESPFYTNPEGLMASCGVTVTDPNPPVTPPADHVVLTVPHPGDGKDASPNIQKAIARAKDLNRPVTLKFEAGKTYEVWPETAYHETGYYISNAATKSENPDGERWSALFLKDMRDVTIEGNDALLLVHGVMTPILIDNSENVTLQNLHVDWARPTMSEVTVKEVGDDFARIQVNESSLYEIDGDQVRWLSEKKPDGSYYWTLKGGLCVQYDPVTDTAWRSGFSWGSAIEDEGDGVLKLTYGSRPGLTVGQTYQFRSGSRDQVGSFIHESKDVHFENMGFHYMHGLGIVGQRTENLSFNKLDCTPRPETGRTCASSADFVQISGCKGLVSVTNSKFKGAHDDVFNIHGTHLRIVGKEEAQNKITVQFKEERSWGFRVFDVGDEIEFINANSMIPYGRNQIERVNRLDDYNIELFLRDSLPANIALNFDAVENVTYTPDVMIKNNYASAIPTRGVLCTTRGEVLIEGNTFHRTQMSGILLEDDARGWYESGLIQNMTIKDNLFDHCGGPVIYSNPQTNVPGPENTVHSNITITGNTFRGNSQISAHHTADLVVEGNTFEDGGSVSLDSCNGFEIRDNNTGLSSVSASNSLNDRSLAGLELDTTPEVETLDRTGMTATASNERGGYEAVKALDGDNGSIWHSDWENVPEELSVTIDLNGAKTFNRLAYLPRQNGETGGMIKAYELYAKNGDGEFTKAAEGSWPVSAAEKYIDLTQAVTATQVKLIAADVVLDSSGRRIASAAEINFQNARERADSVPMGTKFQLGFVATGVTGAPALLPEGAVTFASSNEAVATVAENGTITALAEGASDITITVTAYGKTLSKTATVTVTADTYAAANSITIDPVSVSKGAALQLTATVEPEGAQSDLRWSVSTRSGNAASIDQTGLLTAPGAGRILVSAYSQNDPTVKDTLMLIAQPDGEAADTWSIVRENKANWRLGAGNSLELTTEEGAIWAADNRVRNVITKEAGKDDFSLVTRMNYQPGADYAEAGIILYVDDDHFAMVTRKSHSAYGGRIFSMITQNGDDTSWESPTPSTAIKDTIDASEVYLKLTKEGDVYSSYFSANGTDWTPVYENRTAALGAPPRVGVIGYKGGVAKYGYLEVDGEKVTFEDMLPSMTYAQAEVTAVTPVERKAVKGAMWDQLSLPGTVGLTWNDSYHDTEPVTWEKGEYDGNTVGVYTVEGALETVTPAMLGDLAVVATITVTADKTALREAVRVAKAKVEEGYTPETWAVFAAALKDASDILEDMDDTLTQEAVDARLTALEAALDQLERKADRTALSALVESAAVLLADTADKLYLDELAQGDRSNGTYSADAHTALSEVKTGAEALLEELGQLAEEDEELTEEERARVAQATGALADALEALNGSKTVVDLAELQEKIDRTRADLAALTESDYTVESWAAVEDALAAADGLVEADNYTANEVAAATSAITEAWDGLRKCFSVSIEQPEHAVITSDAVEGIVVQGSDLTLSIAPESGYQLSGLWINDTDVLSEVKNNTYVVENVSENIAVRAEVELEAPPYNPGSPSGSNTTTKTEKNPDGSTTKTVTNKKTGTVTETTTYPDGTKIVAITPKDGETSIEITVPKGKDSVTVTIPTNKKPAPGEVAVIIKADGTKEIIRTSVATDDGMRVTITEGAKLEIMDNSKRFADVTGDHWAFDAVQFAASRELFTGTGADAFSPAAGMTRGMLMTVLARLDGQDTTAGETWYSAGMEWAKERGISDGAAPEADVTRESLAAMLYRYAGSPTVDGERRDEVIAPYVDAGSVSDWAQDAMLWAVDAGILTGKEGSALDPQGEATRAEVAAVLMRFIEI